MSAASGEAVVSLLVQRGHAPNMEAGVAIIAGLAAAVRDALTRQRTDPRGDPLPDHGAVATIPRLVHWSRQVVKATSGLTNASSRPATPMAGAAVASSTFDCYFDPVWLEWNGLRQIGGKRAPPSTLRKAELTGRELMAHTGSLLPNADRAKSAITAVLEAVVELAGGGREGQQRDTTTTTKPKTAGGSNVVLLPFPTLGILRCERKTLNFVFDDELTRLFRPRHQQVHGEDDQGDRSSCSGASVAHSTYSVATGSSVSVARRLQQRHRLQAHGAASVCGSSSSSHPPTPYRQETPAGLVDAYRPTSILSIGERPPQKHSGFRAPDATAVARTLEEACEREVATKERRRDAERREAQKASFDAQLHQVVDAAERNVKRQQQKDALLALDAQIALKRQEKLAHRNVPPRPASSSASSSVAVALTPVSRRAPSPSGTAMHFSDQEGTVQRSRQLAREQLEANRKLCEERRAAERKAAATDVVVAQQSIQRAREAAAAAHLSRANVKLEQRAQLQSAWDVQRRLKAGATEGAVL